MSFEERLADVQTKCSDLDSNNSANRYISNRLAPLIKEGVVNPHFINNKLKSQTDRNITSIYMGHFQIGAQFLSGGLICDATCHIFEKITQHKFKGNISRSFWIPNAKFV